VRPLSGAGAWALLGASGSRSDPGLAARRAAVAPRQRRLEHVQKVLTDRAVNRCRTPERDTAGERPPEATPESAGGAGVSYSAAVGGTAVGDTLSAIVLGNRARQRAQPTTGATCRFSGPWPTSPEPPPSPSPDSRSASPNPRPLAVHSRPAKSRNPIDNAIGGCIESSAAPGVQLAAVSAYLGRYRGQTRVRSRSGCAHAPRATHRLRWSRA
jgi:hypothetical protein